MEEVAVVELYYRSSFIINQVVLAPVAAGGRACWSFDSSLGSRADFLGSCWWKSLFVSKDARNNARHRKQ